MGSFCLFHFFTNCVEDVVLLTYISFFGIKKKNNKFLAFFVVQVFRFILLYVFILSFFFCVSIKYFENILKNCKF